MSNEQSIQEIEMAVKEADLYRETIRYMAYHNATPTALFDRVNTFTRQSEGKAKELQKKYGTDADKYLKKLGETYYSMSLDIGLKTLSKQKDNRR